MKRIAICVSALGLTVGLSACSSGGGSSTSSFDAMQAISPTGAGAPQETVADQLARAPAIAARMDGIAISTIYGETTDSRFPRITAIAACDVESSVCTVREPSLGIEERIGLADIAYQETSYDASRAVLTKNGITLLEERGGTGGPDYRTYGAWMDHAGFFVETRVQSQVEGVGITLRGASARGDLTGSRPTVDAKWRGLMVGTPQRGDQRDNILQGDAELTFDATANELDATFTNIVDLDREAAHSVPEVRFEDVPVTPGGTWGAGGVGNRIEGGFGGPGHAEAAGVFEQQGIAGAYGAKRESPPQHP